MANQIVRHNAQGFLVEQRISDGFINGTKMCVAHGKDISDWLRNDETFDLVQALAIDLNIFPNSADLPNLISTKTRIARTYPTLVIVRRGSPEKGGGTYLHPDLAIQLAQWCSPQFAIAVSRIVRDFFTTGQGSFLWQETRSELKESNSQLRQAIDTYIDRHKEELSENHQRWLFKNTNDAFCLVLFGCNIKKFCRDRSVENFRDSLSKEALKNLEALEILAIRLISSMDIEPIEAVKEAANRLMVGV